jgi:archaellum biogenesis protein FlaJ (TadC family)
MMRDDVKHARSFVRLVYGLTLAAVCVILSSLGVL